MNFRFFILLVMSALLPSEAFGQTGQIKDQIVKFPVGDEGNCPDADSLAGISYPRHFLSSGFGFTFMIDHELRQGFSNAFSDESLTDKVPPLFSRVIIFGAKDDNSRWLVGWKGRSEERICAWLPADALLRDLSDEPEDLRRGPKPKQVQDIERLKDPASTSRNSLTVKVLMSNLNVSGDKGVPIYSSPSAPAPRDYEKLLELYAVYGFGLGVSRTNQNAGHFLIGKDEIGVGQLAGWVSVEDIFEWNNRMAVFGAVPDLIPYALKQDGEATEFTPTDLVSDIPHEEFDKRSRQRFPVLQSRPDEAEIKERVKKLKVGVTAVDMLSVSQKVDGYQVALPIVNCNADGADCVSAQEAENRRIEYRKKVSRLANIDIVLLMDATESMDRYFYSTASAVRQFAKQVLADGPLSSAQTNVRLMVLIYGDYQNGRADKQDIGLGKVVRWHFPARDHSALNDMISFAEEYEKLAPKDKEIDKFEASIAAIMTTAENSKWREDSGFRIIIHLADHGSRPVGQDSGENGSKLKEKYGVNDAVESLRSSDVLYVPISVLGRKGAESEFAERARDAFLRQARDIQDARGIRPNVFKTYRSVGQEETDEERSKAVLDALGEAWNFNTLVEDELELRELCVQSPNHPNCIRLSRPVDSNSTTARINSVIREAINITDEQIRNIHARRDSAVKIWLKPTWINPKGKLEETLTYWVAIESKRFDNLWRGFEELCNLIRTSEDGRDIASRILAGFRPIIGELANEKERRFFETSTLARMLSLPFLERSENLSLTPANIEDLVVSNDPGEIRKLRGAFCRTSYLFQNVNDRVHIYINEDDRKRSPKLDELTVNDEGYVIGSGDARIESDYDWLVKVDRGEGVFYLPFTYFP